MEVLKEVQVGSHNPQFGLRRIFYNVNYFNFLQVHQGKFIYSYYVLIGNNPGLRLSFRCLDSAGTSEHLSLFYFHKCDSFAFNLLHAWLTLQNDSQTWQNGNQTFKEVFFLFQEWWGGIRFIYMSVCMSV